VRGVDLAVHPGEGDRGARARRLPHVGGEPGDQPLVVLVTRRRPFGDLRARERMGPPPLAHTIEVGLRIPTGGLPNREVGLGPVQGEGDRALGIGRGEQHRHRAALGDAEHDGSLRPDGVHHRAHVVHPGLEVGEPVLRHAVREADPALVEQDQAGERREAVQEPGEPRLVPHHLDVRDPAHHEDHVDGPRAHHLVGDVDTVGGLRVAGLGGGHLGPHPRRDRERSAFLIILMSVGPGTRILSTP
jgi:hypothetical protein